MPGTFFTPLHTAAKYESPELVALLLAHGAQLGVRAADGRTPLDVAATIEPQWDRASFSDEPGKLTPARVLCIILLHCAGAPAGALPHR
ncbi:ankyrin repeat domain-containing protein [Gemmata sp. G18]|uniref:Ankyrin repeat domain-containing protein n=1 Tax=Gemmata palustris TaxID=2822762 RepID=A0ABS5BXV9_9BACT|nr:ankyrin repeat domain-containing protein [Gemmata palustris]